MHVYNPHRRRVPWLVLLFKDHPHALIDQSMRLIDPADEQIQPIVKNGRTLVPARFLAEQLGASVDWHEPTQTTTIRADGKEIRMVVGEAHMQVNQSVLSLGVPVEKMKGRTFLPSLGS
ncbi:copper amine oxidase N-terminal domain-containing protein [Ammoniphilus sp. 3BR4]|uniref:copper amine oxidase N-terminal domain-containing protein n=1 Tax=Ammoniphilus sp. 3BR4 TaxID=3158265 RepID=UPI0034665C7D